MKSLLSGLLLLFPALLLAQQEPDTTFTINIENPEYPEDGGPVICIDSGHNNFHTAGGGYAAFSRIARKDGYQVKDFSEDLSGQEVLNSCGIFMIVNPLHESNTDGNWRLPNPSAFTTQEISTINEWVREGGHFFLIADHMPFAGAANELAQSFGFEYSNGFARFGPEQRFPEVFTLENGRLLDNPVSGKEITAVTSFTGSAFTFPEEASPILVFTDEDVSLEPEIAWTFTDSTKTVPLKGYGQGAVMNYGDGKLAVFGEAAMFTAQVVQTDQGPYKFGLNNSELAPYNISFLLELIHWLDD